MKADRALPDITSGTEVRKFSKTGLSGNQMFSFPNRTFKTLKLILIFSRTFGTTLKISRAHQILQGVHNFIASRLEQRIKFHK